MVVLGPFAPGTCDFASRCYIIGATFVNGLFNYRLEHFENSFFWGGGGGGGAGME